MGNKFFGFEVEIFFLLVLVLEWVWYELFDFFVSDFWMLGMDGIEFFKVVKEMQFDVVCLIFFGYVDFNVLVWVVNEVGID